MFKNLYKYKIIFFSLIFNFFFLYNCTSSNYFLMGLTNSLYLPYFGINLSLSSKFLYMITYLMFFSYFINKDLIRSYNYALLIPYLFILIGSSILVYTTNIMVFFLAYETVLIPSTCLVYLFSPNKRSFLVTVYFLLWTQLGSFLVLIASLLLFNKYAVYSFNHLYFLNFYNLQSLVVLPLLIGFGIKIPVWPFHFWLTKTHVEANTSFSIFLSGILVKTALLGLIKFNPLLNEWVNVLIFLVFFGVIDATFKLFAQTDFKKMIAFLTVQEMSTILIVSLFLDSSNFFVIKFAILHTFLSSGFFYASELLYVRRGSRQLQLANGFLNDKPLFSFFFYTLQLLFIGLPFTLKFFIEIGLIIKFITYDFLLFLFFFIFFQFLTIFFFFGLNYNRFSKDLSMIESLLFMVILLPLFLTPFL